MPEFYNGNIISLQLLRNGIGTDCAGYTDLVQDEVVLEIVNGHANSKGCSAGLPSDNAGKTRSATHSEATVKVLVGSIVPVEGREERNEFPECCLASAIWTNEHRQSPKIKH